MNINEYFEIKHQKTLDKLYKIKNENNYLIEKELNQRNYVTPYSNNIFKFIKNNFNENNNNLNSVDLSNIHQILRKNSTERLIKLLKKNYFIPFYVNKYYIGNNNEEKIFNKNKTFIYKNLSPINIFNKNNYNNNFNYNNLITNLLVSNEKNLNSSNKINSNNITLKNKKQNNIKNNNNKLNIQNNKKNDINKNKNEIYEKRKKDLQFFSNYYKI